MRFAIFVCAVVFAANCGNGSDCLPAIAGAAACPASTIIDTSVSDPICLSASGLPLCRGSEEADCYVCSGSQFDDNCLIRDPQQTVECVHKCSDC
ncbi:MAG: hypothetical protein JWM53_3719 [bacterium]|nr:hypothetical protein [bacterium]